MKADLYDTTSFTRSRSHFVRRLPAVLESSSFENRWTRFGKYVEWAERQWFSSQFVNHES
jgi:hypothetical protein